MSGFLLARRHIVNLLFVTLLLALTAYFLLRDGQLQVVAGALTMVDARYMLIGVAVVALFYGCEAWGLRGLLRSFELPVTLRRCYAYALIDFYFSAITPGCCGGQPSQIFYMSRDHIPMGASALSLLMFNMLYHLAVLLIAGGAVALAGIQILTRIGSFGYLLAYGVAAQALLILLFCAMIFSPRWADKLPLLLIGWAARLRLVKDREAAVIEAQTQIALYRQGAAYMRAYPLLMLRTMAALLLHIAALYSLPYWVYMALGGGALSIVEIIAIQALLTLSVEALPLPGGVGVTEGGFLLVYSGVFGSELIVVALLLTRLLNYYLGLAAGGLTAAGCYRRPLRSPQLKPVMAVRKNPA
ncbi:MAG: lysylphosphatidylglycerol synthase transmembrane domain-containing protein [Bacillota bacterium]|nr:lysylphosphatidylglycerol synthase transmembrane domain-containing protein [Bacillota bacterium]